MSFITSTQLPRLGVGTPAHASIPVLIGRTVSAGQNDYLALQRNSTQYGRIGLDSSDRFRLSGPNLSSNALTIDGSDFIQIGPAIASPGVRFYVTDDVWLTGVLRVGASATYGAASLDPDGAIQLGRNITAQAHSVMRIFRAGTEYARVGLDASNQLTLMAGPNDTPALMVSSTGQVGIGVSPATLLHIESTDPTFRVRRSDATAGVYSEITSDTAGAIIYKADPGNISASSQHQWTVDNTVRLAVDANTNLGLGAASLPSAGGPAISMLQGTAPTPASNTAGIWAGDVAGTAELFGFDEAGNDVQLTCHPAPFLDSLPATHVFPWSYSASNKYLGKKINVDMEGLIREVENLSGKKLMFVDDLPNKHDWDSDQENLLALSILTIQRQDRIIQALTDEVAEAETDDLKAPLTSLLSQAIEERSKMKIHVKKTIPSWLQSRL